jgi:hypothetical protein
METVSHETHAAIAILTKYIPIESHEPAVSELKEYLREWRLLHDELLRKIASSAFQ